jgi:hypothetical protein
MNKRLLEVAREHVHLEELKIFVADNEIMQGRYGRLSIPLNSQEKPELWINKEITGDPVKLQKIIEWAKARLSGDK